MIGIYKITNNINNKIYIGQSVNINNRLNWHKELLQHNDHPNSHLQNSVNKYGFENFKFEIIEECDKNDLSVRERYWISHYNSMNEGYNMTSGGENIPGWQQTDEVRNKISEALKLNNGMKRPDVAKRANSDRIWSEESRRKASESRRRVYIENPNIGKEQSRRMKEFNKGRIWVNNGKRNNYVLEKEFLDDLQYKGFVRGMLKSKTK